MQFLRRKLISDIAAGEKIFVYKYVGGLSEVDIRSIFEAIRRYGKLTALLCVRINNDAHPIGTLEEFDDGLFVGYIDRFSTVDINVDVWIDLCRKAESLWTTWNETRLGR
jgi:hypothetical protein